jgi:hypothetical protein
MFTRLNMLWLNVDDILKVVRKNFSDENAFYTKVVENLITNSTVKISSKTEGYILRYGILKLSIRYELAHSHIQEPNRSERCKLAERCKLVAF